MGGSRHGLDTRLMGAVIGFEVCCVQQASTGVFGSRRACTCTGLGSVPAGLVHTGDSVAGAVTNDVPSDAVTGLRGVPAPPCAESKATD